MENGEKMNNSISQVTRHGHLHLFSFALLFLHLNHLFIIQLLLHFHLVHMSGLIENEFVASTHTHTQAFTHIYGKKNNQL